MTRTPTSAELDALTAWWKAGRNIGDAAFLLNRKRQTVANHLMSFRRLEGAADNVMLALKYLDEIERRFPRIIRGKPRGKPTIEAIVNDPSIKRRQYLLDNPEQMEKARARARESASRKRAADPGYQARVAFYQELADMQGGETCAICGEGPGLGRKRRLDIDHDHATDEIRGLLCFNCNQLLGRARDSAEILGKAAAYLQREKYTGRMFAEATALSVAYLYKRTNTEVA